MSPIYRAPAAPLFELLTARLAPHGFVPIDGRWLHRKTWNTNRGVAVVSAVSERELGDLVTQLREDVKPVMKHSWWNQLGLQIVVQMQEGLPAAETLQLLVDNINSQGVLIQSVFAVHVLTRESRQARTWGQLVTGKYQDAIASALAELHAEP